MLAYFDCFSGVSGDMTLGALIHLGVPTDWLLGQLSALGIPGIGIEAEPVHRNGIGAVKVRVAEERQPAARHFGDIRALIEKSPLSDRVRRDSVEIFRRLAAAEAAVHGCEVSEVHFHEVGALDAIVDIVGAVLCLEYLKVGEVAASALPLGSGFVDCRHGRIPVPAPATLALLEGVPVYGTGQAAELVTPTGAAVVSTLARRFGPPPEMIIHGIGYGAGSRELPPGPNLLRVILGRPAPGHAAGKDGPGQERVWVLETCIDDLNPEITAYCAERLLEDGALDVYLIPVQMKKGRPGTMLQAICHAGRREALLERILSETSTLGVRFYPAERRVLQREQVRVSTSLGEVALKAVREPDGSRRLVPEYEECRRIARERNLPLRRVYEVLSREAAEGSDALARRP